MYFGLRRAVAVVNADPGLAALVITGVEGVFAPGGDLGGRFEQGGAGAGRREGMTAFMEKRAPRWVPPGVNP